jgi:hypothetical protein
MCRRLVPAILLALAVLVPSGPAAPSTSHTFSRLSAEQVAEVEWALDLYADAALGVPAIDFVGHDTRDACHGFAGYHDVDRGRSTIHLCGEHRRGFAETLSLHEIAHAWDHAHLTDARRADFLALRGLDQWWAGADREHWDEFGAEHAAEIMVWGLRDRPTHVNHIPNDTCDELLAGYLALTGEHPLHGYRDHC